MSSNKQPILAINGALVSYAHTICAYSAFFAALIVGCSLHYHKIVQNGYYGYPDEWFPSVSATIGDRYPERSIFQIMIALTSGPRFLLLFLCYFRLHKQGSPFNLIGLISGFIRTVTCGGWVYITSTDDHDAHDIFMIGYIILTIPWTLSITKLSPSGSDVKKYRALTSMLFFGSLVPLVYLFIQHKVHRVPGAYSYYAYVEWSLILLDVGFDSLTAMDFKDMTIEISATDNGSMFIETVTKPKGSSDISTKEGLKDVTTSVSNEFSYFHFLVCTLNAFMFWSIITALFVCIWHFPLWYMGISGYEAVIVSLMSPIFLGIPPVKKFFDWKPAVPRILSVVLAIGSFKIEEPSTRLLSISAGTVLVVMSFANELSSLEKASNRDLAIKFYSASFGAGLILSSMSKLAFWTNNPIWPIMHEQNGGCNWVGLAVGIFAAAFTHNNRTFRSSSVANYNSRSSSLFLTSVGLGGLLFSLSAMLTDSTTIILWCWDGYPVVGPMPIPHGIVTLIAMATGVYLGLTKLTTLAGSWKFFLFGSFGAYVLYAFDGWLGYVGGLSYTIFLTASIYPVFIASSRAKSPTLMFFLAFFIQMIFTLSHVWVVAYAFVPGGFLLRERTDIVLGASTLAIAGGLKAYKQHALVGATVVYDTYEEKPSIAYQSIVRKISRGLTVLMVVAAFIVFQRFNLEEPKPYHGENKLITAGIWTIHFGLDNDMWASEHRMRDLIRDAEMDIIGLLESDNQRLIMGNRDVTQFLAEDLGMYADYGPGPNKHTWGCALLSKFPILNSTHHLLPSPVGELAPAIHATLDVYGEMVDVVVFHSGQEEDVEDRRLQSLKLAEIMGSSDRPMILLSYLVTSPLKGNYNTYVSEESGMHDIDPTDWDRWCEYILFKKLKRTGYARISRSSITDTELQVGKFHTISNEDLEEDEAALYTNEQIEEEEVPEAMRFPNIFYGEGVRGHQFHVLDDKPRYYA